jgi:acyl-CoA synthetase (AMP-forming)/AMP-acid ligase II
MHDNGTVSIVGRSKDMIVRGGENIYPTEVEQFLFRHPQIEDVQVYVFIRIKSHYNIHH